MEARSSQQQRSDTALTVLDIVAGYITSAYTLAQLSATNTRCREFCAVHATHKLQALLLPQLRLAAATSSEPLRQHCFTKIKWLCCTASKQAFAASTDAVVAVPDVPLAAVRMLTAAGVCVSDAQAMAAALKQQPGAELWVQARVAVHGPTAAAMKSYVLC